MSHEVDHKFMHPQDLPPPPSTPLTPASTRSYRWSSNSPQKFVETERGLSSSSHFPNYFSERFGPKETRVSKKADVSWLSPSRGDTLRRHVRRGKIKDLAAAFDNIGLANAARNEASSNFHDYSYQQHSRVRNNSEPSYALEERDLPETNFIDDSMLDAYQDELEQQETDEQLYRNYMAEQSRIVESYSQPEPYEGDQQVYVQQVTHYFEQPEDEETAQVDGVLRLSTRAIHDRNETLEEYERPPERMDHYTPQAHPDQSLNASLVNRGTIEQMTSTPRNARTHDDFKRYFGAETSITASPQMTPSMTRRERRKTQAIVGPFTSAPSTPMMRHEFKPQPLSPKPHTMTREITGSLVRTMKEKLERGTFAFHRKSLEDLVDQRDDDKSYDENHNVVENDDDMPEEVGPRPSSSLNYARTANIQMGVAVGDKLEDKYEDKIEEEDLYTIPYKHNRDKTSNKYNAKLRSSLPFSDIAEESTLHDKIDEMFDFVEKTDTKKSVEKLEPMAHLHKIDEEASASAQYSDSREHIKVLSKNSTYQDVDDFGRSEDEACDHVDNLSAHRFTPIRQPPRFTRSPTLVTPHAGQSVTEYRVSDRDGLSTAEKIVLNKSLQPSALATSTPMGTIDARKHRQYDTSPQCIDDSFVSSISALSTIGKNISTKNIVKLMDAVELTKKQVKLAEIALLDAKDNRSLMQEISAQRVLLICRQRLRLQQDEVKRLQAMSVIRHPPPPLSRQFKSTLVISNISVNLNKSFFQRGSYAFVVLLRCRTEVEATGVMTLLAQYQTRMHSLHFGEHLHFSNLPVDFVVTLEVYMMRVPHYEAEEKSCAVQFANKCKSIFVPSAQRKRKSKRDLADDYEAPNCAFEFCGKMTLDRDEPNGEKSFLLDDVVYPLEGTVKLVSNCSKLPSAIDIEYRGYLAMYQQTGNYSNWERFWAMLGRGVIFFWNHPSDETSDKCPLAQIDLTKCTNTQVETSDICAKENTFVIEILVNQSPTLIEKRRVLLSADTSDVLNSWLTAINETLALIRAP